MPVKVTEQVIGVFGSCSVSIPLSDIESQQGFVRVALGFFEYLREMGFEVGFQVVVEIFAK